MSHCVELCPIIIKVKIGSKPCFATLVPWIIREADEGGLLINEGKNDGFIIATVFFHACLQATQKKQVKQESAPRVCFQSL